MKIVCATSVLYGEHVFKTLGDVTMMPDEEISSAILKDADAVVIRSKTKVTPELLDGTTICFVGTATAGVDHMDVDCLEDRGIAWTTSGGCNANSVSEYIISALLSFVQRHGLILSDLTLGVIGVGHVGSAVAQKATALGMKVLLNDPPRKLRDKDPKLLPLDRVLQTSDIVTLHVPLIEEGPFRTRHLVDCRFFEQMKLGSLFLNTSRGEVVDSDALLNAMEHGLVLAAALDVWEHEPCIRGDVLSCVDLGTPHIAGYSVEGRLNGTRMVFDGLCSFFELSPDVPFERLIPTAPEHVIHVDGRGLLDEDILWRVVRSAYDIERDDRMLRKGGGADDVVWSAHFNALRRTYPRRWEFPCTRARMEHVDERITRKISDLGFRVYTAEDEAGVDSW